MKKNEILDYFSKRIFQKLGIVYKDDNYYQLESRLNELVGTLGYHDLNDLYVKATHGFSDRENQIIFDKATNNETSFFRDTKVFDALAKVIDEISETENRISPIHIWCAASSTGQEPYSLAMMLDEKKDSLPGKTFSIVATDISESVLKIAKSAIYDELAIERGLTTEKVRKYFDVIQDLSNSSTSWKIIDSIRNSVNFKSQNLKEDFRNLGQFDVILCRNVLIYQTEESKIEIVERMYDNLKPGGYLLLGGAESLVGLTEKFDLEMRYETTFYQRKKTLLHGDIATTSL